jgi:two-component system response regulator
MSRPAHVDVLVAGDRTFPPEVIIGVLHEQSPDIRVAAVPSGSTAMEFLKSTTHLPKMILLDQYLPDIDGLDLLRRLRSNPPTRTTPVLMMADKSDSAGRHEAYLVGANGFVDKTADPVVLGNRLAIVKHLAGC